MINNLSSSLSNSSLSRKYPIVLTLLTLIGAAVLVIVCSAILFGIAFFFHMITMKEFLADPIVLSIYAQTLSYFPVFAYFAFMIPKITHEPWQKLGFYRPSLTTILLSLFVGVCIIIVVGLTATIITEIFHLNVETATGFLSKPRGMIYTLAFSCMAIIFAPLSEEIAFRGLLFQSFYQRMPLWAAASLSALIFSLAHLSLGSIIPLTIAGIILAVLYAKTKNIWSCIIAHALLNAISTFAALHSLQH